MRRFLKGFVYAWRGITAGVRGQLNIRVMMLAALAAIVTGGILGIGVMEWAVLAAVIGLVLALELVNTAGEKLVDILSPDHDERYGRVKDILAGAVLVASLAAAIVGGLVFGRRRF